MDADITLCRGEGHGTYVCPKRVTCQRYLAIAEDVTLAANGKRRWARMADLMCRHQPGYPYYWEEGA